METQECVHKSRANGAIKVPDRRRAAISKRYSRPKLRKPQVKDRRDWMAQKNL
jgi:hypothetical protein